MEGQQNSQSTQTIAPIDIPVVPMDDFAVVDINDKLNLLMAAINKINTKMHIKFESVQKQLTAEGGITFRITTLEEYFKNY